MKLVTRRAKFKLDQGQEAVGGEGVRESSPPPQPFSFALFFPMFKQNDAFRNPNKKWAKAPADPWLEELGRNCLRHFETSDVMSLVHLFYCKNLWKVTLFFFLKLYNSV